MEPVAWHGTHKIATAGLSIGAAFMGIATDQWIVIASGLGIGIMARAAYLLSLRKPVWRDFMVSIVMAPMNGVLASELVESVALHDARLLLATSLLASSSTMIFVEARKRFLNWHGTQETPAQIFAAPDTTTHVPPKAHGVDVTSVGTSTPQTPSEVEIAELHKRPPVEDHTFDALMRRLEEGE